MRSADAGAALVPELVAGGGEVRFENVRFAYRADRPILNVGRRTRQIPPAIRRALHKAPPDHIIDDMFVSLSILCDGYRVVRDEAMVAYERVATDSGDEFRRKVRIACQAYNCHRLLRPRLRRLPRLLPWSGNRPRSARPAASSSPSDGARRHDRRGTGPGRRALSTGGQRGGVGRRRLAVERQQVGSGEPALVVDPP